MDPGRTVLVLTLCWLVATPGSAAASDEAPEAERAARAHYDVGKRLYDQARFADALAEFEAAYAALPRAALLYDIARCEDQLGADDRALAAYDRFLHEDPANPERPAVEALVQAVRARRRGARKSEPAHAPSGDVIYPYAVGGAGLALLLGSIGTGVAALEHERSLAAACPNDRCDPALQGERDLGARLALATDVLVGVGSAAVAVGVVTLVIEVVRARRARHAFVGAMR